VPKLLKTLVEVTFYTSRIWTYIHVKDLNFTFVLAKKFFFFKKYWERDVSQLVVRAMIKYIFKRWNELLKQSKGNVEIGVQ
jgi:hypothetical protein